MAAPIVVRTQKERRSLTPGYKPPTSGPDMLQIGEAMNNLADKKRYIGTGNGQYIESTLASTAEIVSSVLAAVPGDIGDYDPGDLTVYFNNALV